ncbi:MAG: S16 family serine protease [Microbacteriaceae bacterium]
MALFDDRTPTTPTRRRAGGWIGWSLLGVGALAASSLALIPAPYVIEKPGPVFDTLGEVSVAERKVPLISIPTEETYPTDGSLNLLTVSVSGNPDHLPGWLSVIGAWFNQSQAVVPVDSVFPEGVTQEQSTEQSRVDMENSQREAVAAALTELGHEFSSELTVVETQEGGASDGLLAAGDTIISLNGQTFTDVTGLRAAIAENGTSKPATLVIERDGETREVQVTPELSDAPEPTPVVGILIGGNYDFPFEVDIQIENVGGPSAGMMFALGIVDKLTPGSLTGGEDIAGTGTITASGEVGGIGGIRQKMHGAVAAGADWFLAPESNCDEVAGNIPDGLDVFAVATLDDAIAALEGIASGDTAGLPACSAE